MDYIDGGRLGYHGFWLTSATRHLLSLGVSSTATSFALLSRSTHSLLLRALLINSPRKQINHKSKLADIQDPENRGTIVFAWWMTCLCDAYASAYYRRKPILDDEDYDIDFYIAGPVSEDEGPEGQTPGPSPREQLEVSSTIILHPLIALTDDRMIPVVPGTFLAYVFPKTSLTAALALKGYYRAAHSLARTARQMSRQLWKPAVDSDGVPFETLMTFSTALSEWRDEYLSAVGVPANYSGTWDFVSVRTFISGRQVITR